MTDRMNWTYKQNLKAFIIYRIVKEELDNDNPFPEGKFPSLMEKLKEYRWLDTEKECCENPNKYREETTITGRFC